MQARIWTSRGCIFPAGINNVPLFQLAFTLTLWLAVQLSCSVAGFFLNITFPFKIECCQAEAVVALVNARTAAAADSALAGLSGGLGQAGGGHAGRRAAAER